MNAHALRSAVIISLLLACRHTSPGGWPEKTLTQMSLRQKIGQLLMVSTVPNEDELESTFKDSHYPAPPNHKRIAKFIREHHVGGIFFVGKQSSPADLAGTIQHFQQLNGDRPPLMIALDAEWGTAMRLEDVPPVPQAMTLGALHEEDDHLIVQAGQIAGHQCRTLGVHINLAPVVDVNTNRANPIVGIRSFGQEPERVTRKAQLFAQGLRRAGVLACAKHFPGHGDTSTDSHLTLPHVLHDRDRLDAVELAPYRALIADGIDAIMTAHIAVPALETKHEHDRPASMSHPIVTKLLRDQLGFDGLIITDSLVMDGATIAGHPPGSAELNAFLAGNDILLGTENIATTVALIEQAIDDCQVTEAEIDQRVLRILRAKHKLLTQHTPSPPPPLAPLQEQVFSRAVTLVKNNNNLLPLTRMPAVVTSGTRTSCPFRTELQHLVEQVAVKHANGDAAEPGPTPMLLTIHGRPRSGAIELDKADQEMTGERIRQLIQQAKQKDFPVIAALFATPYTLRHMEDADAVIVGYEDTPAAHQAVSKLLVGQLNPHGVLPVDGSAAFVCGTSLQYEKTT